MDQLRHYSTIYGDFVPLKTLWISDWRDISTREVAVQLVSTR